MSNYSRNIQSNFITQIIGLMLGIFTSIIIARALGPSDRGYAAYLLLIFGLISDYGHLGINNATTYFQKRTDYKINEIYSVNMTFLYLMFVFLTAGSVILKMAGIVFNDYSYLLIFLGLIYVICNFTIVCTNSIYIGDERIIESNAYTLANKGIYSLLIVALWMFRYLNISTYIGVTVLSLFINVILLKINLKVRYRFSINFILLIDEFKYGFIVYLSSLFAFLNYRADQFLIKNMVGAGALGVYSIGVTLAELVFLIPSSVSTALTGRLFNISEKSKEKKLVTSKTIKYTFYICLLMVSIGVCMIGLIPILYGQEYRGAESVTLILFAGVIFASIGKISAPYFWSAGRPQVHLIFTFASFAINVILNLFLIPAYGINGSALASTVSYVIYGGLYMFYFIKKEGFNIKDLLLINREDINLLKTLKK